MLVGLLTHLLPLFIQILFASVLRRVGRAILVVLALGDFLCFFLNCHIALAG